jgi:hypothetical protein
MGWFSRKGPVVIARDEVLGDISRDQHGGYTAQMPWKGGTLPVYLMVERDSEPAVCIGLVKPVIAQLDTLVPLATAYAARELLATANEWVADSGQAPVSEQTLQSRFVLESLTVFEDGVVQLGFDDDEVFAGHVVVVDRDPDGQLANARFEG